MVLKPHLGTSAPARLAAVCNYTLENEAGPGGDSEENVQSDKWRLMHESVHVGTLCGAAF